MSLSAEATDVAAVAETVKDEILVEGNWELIGSTVVTGVVIVFLILAILIFFLWAMGKIFQAVGNAKKKKTGENAAKRTLLPPERPHFAFFENCAASAFLCSSCWWKTVVEKRKKIGKNSTSLKLFHHPPFLPFHKPKGGAWRRK